MRPVDIKYLLATADPKPLTQTEVALSCGVVKSMVYDVIHGNRRNQRVENRIACITRKPLFELWPQWYAPGAQSRRRSTSVVDALQALTG